MHNGIFLSFGTNLGDRIKNLELARERVSLEAGKITALSGIYQTAPWGVTDQPDFFNQVVAISTSLTPLALLEKLMAIETGMGRVRELHWGPRIIDIDILFYGDSVVQEEHLSVPHPAIAVRRFVLEPLAELAADLVHPQLKKDIRTLLKECPDSLPVKKVL